MRIQLKGAEQGSPGGCFRGSAEKTQNSTLARAQELQRRSRRSHLAAASGPVRCHKLHCLRIADPLLPRCRSARLRRRKATSSLCISVTTAIVADRVGPLARSIATKRRWRWGFWSPRVQYGAWWHSSAEHTCSPTGYRTKHL